jgi:hypothetical protein
MLKIIVISLIVANLLLLAFRGNEPVDQEEPVETPAVVEDTSIPTLYLFSELAQDQDLLSGNRQCFSLGPFHSTEDMDEVRTQLQAVSAKISERQTQAYVEKGYWVFLPPYASLLEANQALLSLQALGLKDIAVMYSGDWKNSISLGYFLRQKNAQKRKESLEERGFEALMRVQREVEYRYWLDYEQNPGSGLIALDMRNRPNDFMQRSLPCPEQELFDGPDVEESQILGGGEPGNDPANEPGAEAVSG